MTFEILFEGCIYDIYIYFYLFLSLSLSALGLPVENSTKDFKAIFTLGFLPARFFVIVACFHMWAGPGPGGGCFATTVTTT
jgi:hypothetical protein